MVDLLVILATVRVIAPALKVVVPIPTPMIPVLRPIRILKRAFRSVEFRETIVRPTLRVDNTLQWENKRPNGKTHNALPDPRVFVHPILKSDRAVLEVAPLERSGGVVVAIPLRSLKASRVTSFEHHLTNKRKSCLGKE